MATSKHIEQLKSRIDQLVIQRDHWKQLAENRNSIVVTEVCPDSRSVEEYIIDADSVRSSWRLIRGYREQIEALRQELEAARAELAAVKGQEAVAVAVAVASVVSCYVPSGKRVALKTEYQDLPVGTQLYALPPASPDVEGLVKALELIANTEPDDGTAWFHEVADAALAAYRKPNP